MFTGIRCDYLADKRTRLTSMLKSTTLPTTTTETSTTVKPLPTSLKSKLIAQRSHRLKNLTPSPAGSYYSKFSVQEEDIDPVVIDYNETPRGEHSRIHAVTASPRKVQPEKPQRKFDSKEQKRLKDMELKNARKRFLQQQATITFRQPKILPTIRTKSRPLKLPFTVIDRKHLSLPVFRPRVIDVDRKNGSKNSSSEEKSSKAESSENSKNSSSEVIAPTSTTTVKPSSIIPKTTVSFKTSATSFSSSSSSSTTPLKELSSTTPQRSTSTTLAKITTTEQPITTTNPKNRSSEEEIPISNATEVIDYILEEEAAETRKSANLRNSRESTKPSKGEQTIKDLLEGYDKPKPVLVVDYSDSDDGNEIQKSKDHHIEENLNFIKRRFLQPDSLNVGSEGSQESTSSGPSRPMFLVAVRPIPHPDGTLRPVPASSGNPILRSSSSFVPDGRESLIPQGRSAGSLRGPIELSSPSFSVSQGPHGGLNLRHFAPQTRLSRRIGHSSTTPFLNQFTNHRPPSESGDSMTSETRNVHFYEEHSAGSVHIGVDRHTPPEAILKAFIEIKKSNT